MESQLRIREEARRVAVEAIRTAGRIARERFGRVEDARAKDAYGDVVTEVDTLAEAVLLEGIRRTFPDHRVHSEEAGDNGLASDWLWMIDPLDGTNNYAIGLPVFTVSVTLLYRLEPVLGIVYEPLTDRMFVAGRGEGASCNGRPMRVKPSADVRRGTVSWIQGHQVQGDPRAAKLRGHIDRTFKRMLRLWAPTLGWALLAKGDLDGIVLYDSEGDDLYAGLLMVQEAGGAVVDFDGRPFTGMREHPYLIACHPGHQEELLGIVREGLGL